MGFILCREFRVLQAKLDSILSELLNYKNVTNTDTQSKEFLIEFAGYIEVLISKEWNLINSRMTWLLVSETFLVASYATLINDFEPKYLSILNRLFVMLPVIGILISVIAFVSILSADFVLFYLLREKDQIIEAFNQIVGNKIKMPLMGSKEGRLPGLKWTLCFGSLPNWSLPIIIFLFWLFLLLSTPYCQEIRPTQFITLEDQINCSVPKISDLMTFLSANWIAWFVLILLPMVIIGIIIVHITLCLPKKVEQAIKKQKLKYKNYQYKLAKYREKALKKAKYKQLDDETWLAQIEGIRGVCGTGITREKCRQDLREVLEEWITLKLQNGDPLPIID